MLPVGEADAAYLVQVDQMDETVSLDTKETAGLTDATVAKQVCAFANSGGGFVVFGMKDKKAGGGFDAGVLQVSAPGSRTPVKAWVEQLIPTLHEPPILGCEAKFIQVTGCHSSDRGVVVLSIPRSERRPHWVKSGREEAFIRAGEHSVPMRRQTFLDMFHRARAPEVTVDRFERVSKPEPTPDCVKLFVNPIVRLLGGPCCKDWGLQLAGPADGHVRFFCKEENAPERSPYHNIFILGRTPLFPERPTPAVHDYIGVHVDKVAEHATIVTTLHADSSPSVVQTFPVELLFAGS